MEKNILKVKIDQERVFLGLIYSENIERIEVKRNKNECKYCFKNLSTKENLGKHLKRFHWNDLDLKIMHCDHCELKFFSKNRLNKHLKIKHIKEKEIKYECDFDGKIFKTKMHLRWHLESHLKKEKCEICGHEVKQLRRHKRNIHPEKNENFQCHLCDKKLKSKSILIAHIKTHNKQYQCKICGRKFSNIGSLNEHKKYHDGLFRCKICFKNLKQQGNLKVHMETHDKDRKKALKCQHCEFSTHMKQTLTKHLLIHDEHRVKPLKCNQCDFKTDRKCHLKTHFQTHNPNRVKFPCLYCNYEATARSSLKTHVKIHDPNRVKHLKCSLCKYATDGKREFKRHITNVHKLEI